MIAKMISNILIPPLKLFERIIGTKYLTRRTKRDLTLFIIAWILCINTVAITVLLFSWVISLR